MRGSTLVWRSQTLYQTLRGGRVWWIAHTILVSTEVISALDEYYVYNNPHQNARNYFRVQHHGSCDSFSMQR